MNKNNIDDVILSSRIRLARNIKGLPYPHKMDAKRARELPHDIYSALANSDRYNMYRMAEIAKADGAVLMEKHLISADLLANSASGAAIINESETISIMINEEDHIREQCILPGLKLSEAFVALNNLDDLIAKSIDISFDARLGYLTACPTNLGTGMRASAMLFLPGICIFNSLESCIKVATRLNMTIRGVYGEGSDSAGYIFQVSNQKTLGITEQQIISSVSASVKTIIDAEMRARESLFKTGGDELKDKIMRAFGILTNAYKIESREFMQLIALVKLGAYYGFLNITDPARFNSLITTAQPANIAVASGKELDESARDVFRAAYIGKTLNAIVKK